MSYRPGHYEDGMTQVEMLAVTVGRVARELQDAYEDFRLASELVSKEKFEDYAAADRASHRVTNDAINSVGMANENLAIAISEYKEAVAEGIDKDPSGGRYSYTPLPRNR